MSILRTVRETLRAERARAAGHVHVSETRFLPAALELIERPVSPTGRMTAWLLLAGLAVLLLWLALGRIDIIATAQGRIVPAGQVKLVQSAGGGIVRRILVNEGQRVRKGQVLLLLDPVPAAAALAQTRTALDAAALDAARARVVLGGLDGRAFAFVAPPGIAPGRAAVHARLARSTLAKLQADLGAAVSEEQAGAAALREARVEAAKLVETIPLIREQLDANEALLAKGFVSKLRVIEMRRQYRAALRDRDRAHEAAAEAGARLSVISARARESLAQARAQLLDALARAEGEIAIRRAQLVRNRRDVAIGRLVAPVDGIVTQLTVHTEGGVVQPARPIMTIVPHDGAMIAEVRLLNRDIGFVHAGQRAEVKLEAFPFTRYGTLPGRVVMIAGDATPDARLGPVYTARIALDRDKINIGGRVAPILPGMAITADIRTGRRNFLSYLLSPIETARLESLRER